jgi:phenylalanine-4-hydroxylase
MPRQLHELEKHSAASGHPAPPHAVDWTIDQGWASYSAAEHGVWKTLFERQSRLLPGRACDEFVQGMRALPIGAAHITDFGQLSDVLVKHTGWQVVAVPGLVPDDVFFETSSARRTSSTTSRHRTYSTTCSGTSRCS